MWHDEALGTSEPPFLPDKKFFTALPNGWHNRTNRVTPNGAGWRKIGRQDACRHCKSAGKMPAATDATSTRGGSRTLTPLRALDFESSASAIPPLWQPSEAPFYDGRPTGGKGGNLREYERRARTLTTRPLKLKRVSG